MFALIGEAAAVMGRHSECEHEIESRPPTQRPLSSC
jgi:hypothetical protein